MQFCSRTFVPLLTCLLWPAVAKCSLGLKVLPSAPGTLWKSLPHWRSFVTFQGLPRMASCVMHRGLKVRIRMMTVWP